MATAHLMSMVDMALQEHDGVDIQLHSVGQLLFDSELKNHEVPECC